MYVNETGEVPTDSTINHDYTVTHNIKDIWLTTNEKSTYSRPQNRKCSYLAILTIVPKLVITNTCVTVVRCVSIITFVTIVTCVTVLDISL